MLAIVISHAINRWEDFEMIILDYLWVCWYFVIRVCCKTP